MVAGNSALHIAATSGDVLAAQLLLDAGANAKTPNKECGGATPVDFAEMYNNVEVIELLSRLPQPRRAATKATATTTTTQAVSHQADILVMYVRPSSMSRAPRFVRGASDMILYDSNQHEGEGLADDGTANTTATLQHVALS